MSKARGICVGVGAAAILVGIGGAVFASDQTTTSAAKAQTVGNLKNRVTRRVPAFPSDVKARGDKLRNTASQAVRTWAGQHAPGIAHGTTDPEAASLAAAAARWPSLRPSPKNTVGFLLEYWSAELLQAEIQAQLDSKSEMGETESLRLQMAMDRLSKLMSSLSNILKKLSDTDDAIVQNLK